MRLWRREKKRKKPFQVSCAPLHVNVTPNVDRQSQREFKPNETASQTFWRGSEKTCCYIVIRHIKNCYFMTVCSSLWLQSGDAEQGDEERNVSCGRDDKATSHMMKDISTMWKSILQLHITSASRSDVTVLQSPLLQSRQSRGQTGINKQWWKDSSHLPKKRFCWVFQCMLRTQSEGVKMNRQHDITIQRRSSTPTPV